MQTKEEVTTGFHWNDAGEYDDDLHQRMVKQYRWSKRLLVTLVVIAGDLKWWSSLPSGLWWLYCSHWQDYPLHRYWHPLLSCGWVFQFRGPGFFAKKPQKLHLSEREVGGCLSVRKVWFKLFIASWFIHVSFWGNISDFCTGVNRTERARRAYIINCRPKVELRKLSYLKANKCICIIIWPDKIVQAMVELERAKKFDHGLAGVGDILQEHSKWCHTYIENIIWNGNPIMGSLALGNKLAKLRGEFNNPRHGNPPGASTDEIFPKS